MTERPISLRVQTKWASKYNRSHIQCDCGAYIRKTAIRKHEKTASHLRGLVMRDK